jgi:hypothetical protein
MMGGSSPVHPRSAVQWGELGFVRAISSLGAALDCEESMKHGFVRAICHPDHPQADCHYGRIGFVRALLKLGDPSDYEGFMKNGFVRAISVGCELETLLNVRAMTIVCIHGTNMAWPRCENAQLMERLAADRCIGCLGLTMHGVGVVLREVGVYRGSAFLINTYEGPSLCGKKPTSKEKSDAH